MGNRKVIFVLIFFKLILFSNLFFLLERLKKFKIFFTQELRFQNKYRYTIYRISKLGISIKFEIKKQKNVKFRKVNLDCADFVFSKIVYSP